MKDPLPAAPDPLDPRPGGSSTPDPLELLVQEHEEGLKFIRRLREAAEDIRTRGFSTPAFERVGEAIRFFDTEMRRHNEKEEEFLLPLLGHYIPGAPLQMRREHRAIWAAFEELRGYVHDIEEGRLRGSAIMDLVECANLIVEMLGEHIARENDELFPAAKRLLNVEEYGRLANGMLGAARGARKPA
jgi:hemerythrin-like domain-containing protein